MPDKIKIDQSNVLMSKDDMKIGMHLWNVGAGGTAGPSKPYYEGQLIGFGSADYTFERGAQRATGFIIKDSYSPDVDFAVVASTGGGMEQIDFDIPEGGYQKHIDYPLNVLGHHKAYVYSRSYMPQSYHNWYLCDSEEKALAVYEEMLAKWTPEHEAEREAYVARMDEFDHQDYGGYDDYEYPEDDYPEP